MKKIVIPVFGLLALVAVIYFFRPANPPADKAAKTDDKPDASLLTYSPAGSQTITNPASIASTNSSVSALVETKATPAFTGQLEAFKKAFETADYGMTELQSNLVNELKSDPAKMPMVVDWMKSQTNAEFTTAMADIIAKNCGQAGTALLEKTALELAKDADSPAHRNTALGILSALTEPDAATLQIASQLAQTDADPKNRSLAIDALGKWMMQSSDAQMQTNAQLQLAAAVNAPGADEKLRGHAFTYFANQKGQLSADVLQSMPNLLQQQSDPQNRASAASMLGLASDDAKDYALKQLADGLPKETDPETKRVIAAQMVKLGGMEQVRALVANDPDLIQQMEAYQEMLKHNAKH